jgi:hypothetical protein
LVSDNVRKATGKGDMVIKSQGSAKPPESSGFGEEITTGEFT